MIAIVVHGVGLLFSLYLLEYLFVSGLFAKTHRQLPLILGTVSLFHVLRLVTLMGGRTSQLSALRDLLILQLCFFLSAYFRDFIYAPTKPVLDVLQFTALLLGDAALLVDAAGVEGYRFVALLVLILFTVEIDGMGIVILVMRHRFGFFRRRMLFLMVAGSIVPLAAMIAAGLDDERFNSIVALAMLVSCSIVYYLIHKNDLIDTAGLLRENFYRDSAVPTLLLDDHFDYLDSNAAAKAAFPKETGLLWENRYEHPFGDFSVFLQEYADRGVNSLELGEFKHQNNYYKKRLTQVMNRGVVEGYVLSFLDVTKEKEDLMVMSLMKHEAQRETELKNRFMARMSHDLRTPLHAVLGIADVLLSQSDISSRNRGMLFHIKSAGDTLLELVNSILSFSKLESGKAELKKERYDLLEMLRELSYMGIVNLEKKPVALRTEVTTRFPAELIGDPLYVREMLQNIIGNAVKFTEEGEIVCLVSVCEGELPDEVKVTCSVRDTGPGMTPRQLENCFKEYLTYAGSAAKEGSGLGLSIVAQLSALMGGEAKAESDGKTGTTMTVSFLQKLPAGVLYRDTVEITRESLERSMKVWQKRVVPDFVYPTARILVADDMEVNLRVFREMVAPWNPIVTTAVNGKEAVEAVKKQHFDLVVLDIMMPELNGLEAAAEMRKFTDTPIVALTADMTMEIHSSCTKGDFNDTLLKPLDLKQLQSVLEKFLPPEKRRQNEGKYSSMSLMGQQAQEQSVVRILESYLSETEPLLTQLSELINTDLNAFRIKIHGIKGTSRQIGQEKIADLAEALEMAAKTENRAYIGRHIEDFLVNLAEILEEVKSSLEHHRRMLPEKNVETGRRVDVREEFRALRLAFVNFDFEQMNERIENLLQANLSEQESELLEKARKCCVDFEYDEGMALLDDYQ